MIVVVIHGKKDLPWRIMRRTAILNAIEITKFSIDEYVEEEKNPNFTSKKMGMMRISYMHYFAVTIDGIIKIRVQSSVALEKYKSNVKNY